ncbi:hypothetical protein [Butyrivibrio sp. INlla14]|uniref:hypothetical protein n=1 Tax=Butyrivibrio sp. INlla14 TaxID=1520808 RepID=UPI0015A30EB0|nr:hypothetical protein [Butyrivibrio sp. INlla14]
MSQKDGKPLPPLGTKPEIKVKQSPAAEALRKAPDEAIARAIHDTLLRQKEGPKN